MVAGLHDAAAAARGGVAAVVEDVVLVLLPVERLHEPQHHGGERVLAGGAARLQRGAQEGARRGGAALQVVGAHGALLLADAPHVDRAAALEGEAALAEDEEGVVGELDAPADPRAVHAARQVHRLAPDVVLRLLGANHPGDHGAVGHACETGSGLGLGVRCV